MGSNPLPYVEQGPLVIPLSSVLVPDLLGTTGEPQREHSVNQAPRTPESTPKGLNSSASGIFRAPITPPALSSRQEASAELMLSGPPQLEPEGPSSTQNRELNQLAEETCVELVVPGEGPTTGGEDIAILGKNFPAVPLYVWFGGNSSRAVSFVRYHLSLVDAEICYRCGVTPVLCYAVSLHRLERKS